MQKSGAYPHLSAWLFVLSSKRSIGYLAKLQFVFALLSLVSDTRVNRAHRQTRACHLRLLAEARVLPIDWQREN